MMNKLKNKLEEVSKRNSFKSGDQAFFAQRLSLLLNSGISIVEALAMISNMDSSKHRKIVYGELIANIQQGISLSKSIKISKIKFNSLLLNLIQNGETTGRLSEALLLAFNYLEKKNDLKKKIFSSLMYPVFIVIATIAMTLFLILYIFPKIIPLLKSLDIKLPLITRIVQAIYFFSMSYGIWLILGLIILFSGSYFLIKKYEKVKFKLHQFFLSIPLLSAHLKVYLCSSVCSMSEMLLSSGKSLPEIILFSHEFSRNMVYKKIFKEIYDESIQGVSFSVSLKKYDKFPVLFSDMCALGERTGNLALMLGHLSRIFEQDIENSLKKFSSLIEPALMILMGLLVGSIALSIILPVYEITNHLTK